MPETGNNLCKYVKMQQRITPILNASNNFSLRFPQPIAIPDDDTYTITSSTFRINGNICSIRNRLGSSTLEIVRVDTSSIEVDNVGSYNANTGTLSLVAFRPGAFAGSSSFIKIKAVPANQSAITPTRNEVLVYDTDESFATGVLTTAQN